MQTILRPSEGVLKNAIEKRFVNETTEMRPDIINQHQTKTASVLAKISNKET